MDSSTVVRIVEKSIDSLCSEFKANPFMFYTENDLVCRLCRRLQERLPEIEVRNKVESKHLLVHTEYPTPFRCYMKGTDFKPMDESYRGRGHYDIVVLNPALFGVLGFEVINGQSYKLLKQSIIDRPKETCPIILFGVELKYVRRRLRFSKGVRGRSTVETEILKTLQDHHKLEYGKRREFIQEVKSILFLRDVSPEVKEHMERELYENHRDDIRVVTLPQP